MKNAALLLTACLATTGFGAQADTCGAAPTAPDLPNGKKASMEELVTSSKAVKQYIADADQFLNCREAYFSTTEFEELAKKDQTSLVKEHQAVLKIRNRLGDDFNAEVAAFQKVNAKE